MTSEEIVNATRANLLGQAIAAAGIQGVAATQLGQLWKDDFQIVTDEAGRFALKSATGEAPEALIRARLSSDDYRHFGAPSPAPSPLEADLLARARAYAGLSNEKPDYVGLGRY